jgi:hypothetical protein
MSYDYELDIINEFSRDARSRVLSFLGCERDLAREIIRLREQAKSPEPECDVAEPMTDERKRELCSVFSDFGWGGEPTTWHSDWVYKMAETILDQKRALHGHPGTLRAENERLGNEVERLLNALKVERRHNAVMRDNLNQIEIKIERRGHLIEVIDMKIRDLRAEEE